MRIEGVDVLEARAWLDHADGVLDLLESVDETLETPFAVPADVIKSFRVCLDEWREGLCPHAGELMWRTSMCPDELRRLMTYWLNLAIRTNDGNEVERSSGTRFYLSVVDAALDELASDRCTAEFAATARSRWPGLGAVCGK